ncbi:unnamed protein product [Rotaria socialis]
MAREKHNNDDGDDDELMERKFTARELIAALAYRQFRQRDQSSSPTSEFSTFPDNSDASEYLSSYVPSNGWSSIESSFQQDEPSLWHKYSSSIRRRSESSLFPDNLPESSDASEYLSSYVPSSDWSISSDDDRELAGFQSNEPTVLKTSVNFMCVVNQMITNADIIVLSPNRIRLRSLNHASYSTI